MSYGHMITTNEVDPSEVQDNEADYLPVDYIYEFDKADRAMLDAMADGDDIGQPCQCDDCEFHEAADWSVGIPEACTCLDGDLLDAEMQAQMDRNLEMARRNACPYHLARPTRTPTANVYAQYADLYKES